MKQHDIRDEIKKYIDYLRAIKDNPIKGGELTEVCKSLEAILAKTRNVHY